MGKNRLMIVGLSAVLVVWVIHFATNHISQLGGINGHTVSSSHGPSAMVRSLRPSYPYSIIAGGAYSQGELLFANGKDSVVRQHYLDFDVKHARMVRLVDDRFQYVSYRIKDQVYWTKKKLRIPVGELLITDGQQYARARCGNRLSDQPHKANTSPQEPDSALLTLPPVNLDLLPKLALAMPPASRDVPAESRTEPVSPTVVSPWPVADKTVVPMEPVWGGQPYIGGPGSYVSSTPPGNPGSSTSTSTAGSTTSVTQDPGKAQSPPAANIPEPSSLYLFAVTLFFVIWALLRVTPKSGEEGSNNGK